MDMDTEDGTLISFDEAGFTGPQLLDQHQPYFVYASHDLQPSECEKLISDLRARYPIQGNELKAKNLKHNSFWAGLCQDLSQKTDGRSLVVTYNKKVALSGKFVEYFFEPVLSANSRLFYSTEFHKYIMNVSYLLLNDSSLDYTALAAQMQLFMRSFDPTLAPVSLFGLEIIRSKWIAYCDFAVGMRI
jgi:hypothetical protein